MGSWMCHSPGRPRLVVGLWIAALGALGVGCGGDAAGGTETSAEVDAGPDTWREVEWETEVEVEPDGEAGETEPEVDTAVGPDAPDTEEVTEEVADTGDTGEGLDTGDSSEDADGDGDDSSEDSEPGEVDGSGDGDTAETEDTSEVTEPDVPVLSACEPALSGDVERFALGRQLRRLSVVGGTGDYRYELVANTSGAILNAVTGEYVSGPTVGGTDRVRVSDVGCVGELVVEVHVVEPMVVFPSRVELRPNEGFRPDASGGSGAYDLELAMTGTSGGRLTGSSWAERRFVAGPLEGFETVMVVDVETGETREVPVTVDVDAVPAFSPPWLFLPPGAVYPVASIAGSGELSLTAIGEGPSYLDDPSDPPRRWDADSLGVSRVTAVDLFLGMSFVQHAVGIGGAGPVAGKSGQQLELWTALAPGDLDGDGFAEAIVGAGERTQTLPISGGVFLYRGGADGPVATPVRVFQGEQRNEQFGSALALGDFDGDGVRDLAIGGPRYRVGTITPGRVVVFSGEVGGYAATAGWTGTGVRNADLFGHALAACDFDGDGYDDLAVGAFDSEDSVAPVVANQGGVFFYRGGPGGLALVSNQVIWGRVPSESGWVGEVDLRFGRVMAAGDLDGDGACELVVGSPTAAADNGVVWVFAGDLTGAGLVLPTPSVVWRGTRAGRFGWALAVGDLNGDTTADLVIGQPRWSTSAVVADNHGALRIKAGGPWVGTPATAAIEADLAAFDHTILNPNTTSADTNDELGFRIEIGELTGDERADLVVAGIADEVTCTGCVSGAGAVHVLGGRVAGWPVFPAAHGVGAGLSTDRQGSALAILGVVDGSGEAALLSVLGREDSEGADYGRAMVMWPRRPGNTYNAVQATLEMPSLPFGWRVGQGLEVLPDLDGDGYGEVVVGAPQGAGPPASGAPPAFSGYFTVHRGTASGLEATPWQTMSTFRRLSGADRWGWELAALPDFDGDGRVDVAVVSRNEDATTNYGTGTISTAACNVARTDSGAVAIFGTTAAGLDAQPMLMHFGVQASQVLEVVTGADVDGDGKTDLIVGSRFWDRPTTGTGDNGGAFEIVFGKARAHATSTEITCEAGRRHFGFAAADGFAAALVGLGDLDDDGCEEFAVGIPGADHLGSAGGAVEVFFGAGAGCASAEVRRVVIAAPTANTGLGNAMFARDVDGDGLAELVVAGSTHRVSNIAAGGAWVVPGTVLAGLAAQATTRADDVAATAVRLFGVDGLVLNGLAGQAANELFGTGVALVPARGPSPAMVAVASQSAVVGGVNVGGLVAVHRLMAEGGQLVAEPRPFIVVGAEPHGGLPTARMAVHETPAGRHLLIGASESSAVAAYSGAIWVVPLDGLAALESALEVP